MRDLFSSLFFCFLFFLCFCFYMLFNICLCFMLFLYCNHCLAYMYLASCLHMDFQYLARLGGGHFNNSLVSLYFSKRLVSLYLVAFLDQPLDYLSLMDSLSNIRKLEFVRHFILATIICM